MNELTSYKDHSLMYSNSVVVNLDKLLICHFGVASVTTPLYVQTPQANKNQQIFMQRITSI